MFQHDVPPGGLYDPRNEHDACGIGFVANITGEPKHNIVRSALKAVSELVHRGACDADAKTGDGAGILMQICHEFFRQVCDPESVKIPAEDNFGVGMLFLPRDEQAHEVCRILTEEALSMYDLPVLGWRVVPVDISVLGDKALETRPDIRQVMIGRPKDMPGDKFERTLFLARKRIENQVNGRGIRGFYIPSMSCRTIVYKGLFVAPQLGRFYLDLTNNNYRSALAVFHQRYSTNTFPNWALAQPFRMVGHNGEINTLQGNLNWIRAREKELASDLWGDEIRRLSPVVQPGGSDSANLDNVLELLALSGRSPLHSMLMMAPAAWENDPNLSPELRAFHEYHAMLTEPWDGPAALVFTDGRIVGATLDRNGLRPARYKITRDGLIVVASEVGILELSEDQVVEKGRLGPGRMIAVDVVDRRLLRDADIRRIFASRQPYGEWLGSRMVTQPLAARSLDGHKKAQTSAELVPVQRALGYGAEDLKTILLPMLESGKEAVGSMGDDTPLACLSSKPRMIFDYFKQRFAQVTNPPIDPIRERMVMSLNVYLGAAESILTETPEQARRIKLNSPILSEQDLVWLESVSQSGLRSTRVSVLFDPAAGEEGFAARLDGLRHEAEQAVDNGATVIVLSDRGIDEVHAALPMMLAVSAVHHHLIRVGKRMRTSLVLDSGEPRTTHHFACLLGYGASAIHPWMAWEQVRAASGGNELGDLSAEEAANHVQKAVEDGVLKIMSKMGISTMASYIGAQIFEAVGLSQRFLDECFPGTRCQISGVGMDFIARDVLAFHAEGFAGSDAAKVLVDEGYYKVARNGEYHHNAPDIVRFLQGASGVKPLPEKVFKDADEELKRVEAEVNVAVQDHVLSREAYRPVETDFDPENMAQQGEFIDRIRRLHSPAVGARGRREYEIFSALVNRRPASSPRDLLDIRSDRKNSISIDQVEPATEIMKRFTTAAMSLGALSPEAHEALAVAMNRIGGKSNSGEGGEDPRRFRPDENGDLGNSAIKQVASGRFGVTPEYLASAKQIEIKMAQGSKPGEGGQLPGHKVTLEIARLRHSTPGVTLISPPPHHDIYSIEDLAQLIYDLKMVNSRAKISVKLVAEAGIGTIAAGVAKASADLIHISGHDGGTGASPFSSIKSAGSPWELGLAEAQQVLIANGLRGHVTLRVDGGFKTGRDVMIAALLGAEEYGFGTAVLIATGCVMARKCHLNTCPVGVATQKKDLRAKFKGTPEHVVEYLTFVAEEVREYMAAMGYRKLDDLVGRVDLLYKTATNHPKWQTLDYGPMLFNPDRHFSQPHKHVRERNERVTAPFDDVILQDAHDAVTGRRSRTLNYFIRNVHRAVGARVAGQIAYMFGNAGLTNNTLKLNFTGSAGQSFGAFCINGLHFTLQGEANDYVGKGMNGGSITVKPDPNFGYEPSDNVIVGNTVLYGATGGKLFVRGRAGERFAVRNSGARAVVEGLGNHGCEYMTGGIVLVLGGVGENFAAGMTGGVVYVYDPLNQLPARLNSEHVEMVAIDRPEDVEVILEMLEEHSQATGSALAARLVRGWDEVASQFVRVQPCSSIEESKPAPEASASDTGKAQSAMG